MASASRTRTRTLRVYYLGNHGGRNSACVAAYNQTEAGRKLNCSARHLQKEGRTLAPFGPLREAYLLAAASPGTVYYRPIHAPDGMPWSVERNRKRAWEADPDPAPVPRVVMTEPAGERLDWWACRLVLHPGPPTLKLADFPGEWNSGRARYSAAVGPAWEVHRVACRWPRPRQRHYLDLVADQTPGAGWPAALTLLVDTFPLVVCRAAVAAATLDAAPEPPDARP